MPKVVSDPPSGFDDLSVDKQIEYVQSLWDRIAATPDQVRVPEWHLKVIRERLEKLEANPDRGRPWEEVRNDLERKLRESSSE